MYYTLVLKSGWVDDYWRLGQTFTNADEAKAAVVNHKRNDVREMGYCIDVKRHRKPLSQLLTSHDNVRFTDGTEAWPMNVGPT